MDIGIMVSAKSLSDERDILFYREIILGTHRGHRVEDPRETARREEEERQKEDERRREEERKLAYERQLDEYKQRQKQYEMEKKAVGFYENF